VSSGEKPLGVAGADDDAQREISDVEEVQAARAANRFDIRRLIGGCSPCTA
jgi:hypothetical protein